MVTTYLGVTKKYMDIDDALSSIENWRKYLDELPDVADDEMYRVDIHYGDDVQCQYLVLQDDYDSAIEVFDAKFLMQHTGDSNSGDKIELLSPCVRGGRVVLASYDIVKGLTNG